MNLDKKQLAILIAIVVAAAGAYAWYRHPANTPDVPNGTFWLCQNPQCKADFNLSVAQLSAHHEKHYGEPVPCPKCGKTEAIRGFRCDKCAKVYPAEHKSVCPFCNPGKTPAPDRR